MRPAGAAALRVGGRRRRSGALQVASEWGHTGRHLGASESWSVGTGPGEAGPLAPAHAECRLFRVKVSSLAVPPLKKSRCFTRLLFHTELTEMWQWTLELLSRRTSSRPSDSACGLPQVRADQAGVLQRVRIPAAVNLAIGEGGMKDAIDQTSGSHLPTGAEGAC